jgi:S1/P1 Nuclease
MHQPCHVGDNQDMGGNNTQVRFFDRGTNMHALWDSGMIQRAGNTEEFWLGDLAALDTPGARATAMKGTVEDWATESLLAARQAYQVPETGVRLKSGQKLADAYLEANVPVVRRRLHQVGVSLAWVLNQAFSAEGCLSRRTRSASSIPRLSCAGSS